MATEIHVEAQSDHIESLSKAAPASAIEELVWNALDADAHEVRVELVTNDLGAVLAVKVSDDGTGIDMQNAHATFGSLGGSWKRDRSETQATRRRLHGRHGCGRFKSFALGSHVEWRTTAMIDGTLRSYCLWGDIERPGVFEFEAAAEPGPATGTEVCVTNVRANCDALLNVAETVQTLASKFALYLKSYPGVRIYFNGLPVTPVIVQQRATSYKLTLPQGGEAKLEVIEWKRKFVGAGHLVFAGGDGFQLHEQSAMVRSGGIPFTAYLVSSRLPVLQAENALVMGELNPEVRGYLEEVRKILKAHFAAFVKKASPSFISEWKERINSLTNDEKMQLMKLLKKSLKTPLTQSPEK